MAAPAVYDKKSGHKTHREKESQQSLALLWGNNSKMIIGLIYPDSPVHAILFVPLQD